MNKLGLREGLGFRGQGVSGKPYTLSPKPEKNKTLTFNCEALGLFCNKRNLIGGRCGASTVNPTKLETGLKPNSARIPYTLVFRIEAIGFPTFPRNLRTHILRLLGPKTILHKAFGLF